MKIPRELLLIFAVLLVVAAATQQLVGDQQQKVEPELVSDSAAPGGARALYLWLESLGYRVERMEYRAFKIDDSSGVLFMLVPTSRPEVDELNALRRWVADGGTLVLAGISRGILTEVLPGARVPGSDAIDPLLRKFDLELRRLDSTPEAKPVQPLLLHPAVSNMRVDTSSFVTGTSALVSYLGEPERPIAAGLAVGKGHVFVIASSYALSNQGLGQADNWGLLLNWLPEPGKAGKIVFDEVHHGRSGIPSLAYVVTHEPWGWALFYGLGITFLYLALRGRRFGRPVPSIPDTRRAASEYVISLSGLLRRGRKSDWVARHYEDTLRRRLATSIDIDPTLSTPEVAERVGAAGRLADGADGKEACRVLMELSNAAEKGVKEPRLVRLAADADRIIKNCSGRRE